jgi:hypothetical protein
LEVSALVEVIEKIYEEVHILFFYTGFSTPFTEMESPFDYSLFLERRAAFFDTYLKGLFFFHRKGIAHIAGSEQLL